MSATVVIMAGGTGGHVFPALAVADELTRRGAKVVWMGTQRGLEARLVPAAGYPVEWISVRGLRGSGWRRWLGAPVMLGVALWQALRALRRVRPTLVLGMGGFASGPGGVAARLLGIPLLIHEQNARPGTTNRWLARWASAVMAGFPAAFPAAVNAQTVGNPVRRAITALPPPQERWQERAGEPVRLLVLGGSQGARALNQTIPAALAQLPTSLRLWVRHQTGERLLTEAQAAYRQAGVEAELVAFIDDMASAYGWADLVIARSGALTVAELAAAGVGAILIPFPYATDDHQRLNAEHLAAVAGAQVVLQSALTPTTLAAELTALLSDRRRLLAMATAARQAARPDATEAIAERCMALAQATKAPRTPQPQPSNSNGSNP